MIIAIILALRIVYNILIFQMFSKEHNYFNGIQVYTCINDIAPMHMSDFLHLNSEYNSYTTRHVDDNAFYVPRPRIELYRQ